MAQILDFLRQSAHRAKYAEDRQANTDYKMHNEKFYLPLAAIKAKDQGELGQYCSLYYNRLRELKPLVKEAAEMKWAGVRPHFMENILDMKPGQKNVIIGTLFKE